VAYQFVMKVDKKFTYFYVKEIQASKYYPPRRDARGLVTIGLKLMIEQLSKTVITRKRYDRLAIIYDFLEAPLEWHRFARWRSRLTNRTVGDQVLEVGVGTGKNLPYYPRDVRITAIDFSCSMLKRARKRASLLGSTVQLQKMDVQHLDFSDNSFDTVFATFVFCSVPDPVAGLKELKRVCRPNGRLLLLEHMRPSNVLMGLLFDAVNPIVVRMMGANINRRTMENIKKAGWQVLKEEHLSGDIVRWIEAKPSSPNKNK
jgi:ubiquinone/menaquinone biosynthesis C-methylase UbiE